MIFKKIYVCDLATAKGMVEEFIKQGKPLKPEGFGLPGNLAWNDIYHKL